MAQRSNYQQLLVQVSRAREALGNALGLIQDIQVANLDLEKVTTLLATSVRLLFEAQEKQLKDAKPVGDAMQNLRDILQMMQEIGAENTQLQAAITTIARILALLFPVYKELSISAEPEAGKRVSAVPKRSSAASIPADDRRLSPRKEIEVDIGLQSDSNFFTGFSTDISSGGLFVATFDAPQIGHVVNLNFHLPGGPAMSVNGEVRWVREYNETTPDILPGVGVRFLQLSAQDARHINEYIKNVQPMFFEES
ncbi:MAG: TIGR02266 family protein [Deltaproteobacteria bacterium]|nr:TIGR02266 family protein [Deltaproteobacteria bacterium]